MAHNNFGTHFIKTKFHVNSSRTQILSVSLGHFPGSPVSVQSINYHPSPPRAPCRILGGSSARFRSLARNISCAIF